MALIAVLGLLAMCGASRDAAADPVALAVEFKLTDLDYRPLPGVPVRLAFGSTADWQGANTGHRFTTDADGTHRFSTTVVLDKQWRKLPTNFYSSLVGRPQQTDHLTVAAELVYMTFPWLYAVDVYRFPAGGPVLLDGVSVYTRDARGAFTNKARQDAGGWRMADLGGLALTNPGHEPWSAMLEPDPADPAQRRWILRIAFKRSPAPVRR